MGMSKCSKACSALYHAVLALGIQVHGGGSFTPGLRMAWKIFQSSLGLFPDIIVPPYSLTKLQVFQYFYFLVFCVTNQLTGFDSHGKSLKLLPIIFTNLTLERQSIFAMNPCCLQLDQALVYEAARMAQSLRYHKSSNAKPAHLKAFWTVYHLEKMASFSDNNSSVCSHSAEIINVLPCSLTIKQIFSDEDIGCGIPSVPESVFGDYNWFLSGIKLGRLTSIAYTTLFTTGSSLKPATERLTCVENLRIRLEEWRSQVPAAFRPKEPLLPSELTSPKLNMIAIQTHYLYYHLFFAVERVYLHIDPNGELQGKDNKWNLMSAACNVIEIVQFIDIQPHMPVL